MNQLPESSTLSLLLAVSLAALIGWALIEGLAWVASHVTIGWS